MRRRECPCARQPCRACGPTSCAPAPPPSPALTALYTPCTLVAASPPSQVCCRDHDKCCGHGDRSTCNRMIVECLSACDKMSLTCTLDGVPVPAGGIEAAMDIVEDWCCGSPCS